jgi:hypothetical protein
MKIRVDEKIEFQAEKLAKIVLGVTGHFQLDLYCVAPGQAQKAHTHDAQDKVTYVGG